MKALRFLSMRSLSARRAWIEIAQDGRVSGRTLVALRKESVDRNFGGASAKPLALSSLSARRAWIEITYVARLPRAQVVALRKESVDRNHAVLVVPRGCWVALRKESVDRNCYFRNDWADQC